MKRKSIFYLSYRDNKEKRRRISKAQLRALLKKYVIDTNKWIDKLKEEGCMELSIYYICYEEKVKKVRKKSDRRKLW